MTRAEVLEEIRVLLAEPQANTVSNPWSYGDDDFIAPLRSGLRYLAILGVPVEGEIAPDGEFLSDPSDMEGMLLAYYVASKILSSDLLHKLADGELGVLFKAGSDTIDTKAAARSFEATASSYKSEFAALLAIAMADADGGAANVWGDGTAMPKWGEI